MIKEIIYDEIKELRGDIVEELAIALKGKDMEYTNELIRLRDKFDDIVRDLDRKSMKINK